MQVLEAAKYIEQAKTHMTNENLLGLTDDELTGLFLTLMGDSGTTTMCERLTTMYRSIYGDPVAETIVAERVSSRVTKSKWKNMSHDDKVKALLVLFKDPDDAEKYASYKFDDLPNGVTENVDESRRDRLREADEKVHRNEDEWHFKIMKKFGWKLKDKKPRNGMVRSYVYVNPKYKNHEIYAATGAHGDHWKDQKHVSYKDGGQGYGYWSDLEPWMKKLKNGEVNESVNEGKKSKVTAQSVLNQAGYTSDSRHDKEYDFKIIAPNYEYIAISKGIADDMEKDLNNAGIKTKRVTRKTIEILENTQINEGNKTYLDKKEIRMASRSVRKMINNSTDEMYYGDIFINKPMGWFLDLIYQSTGYPHNKTDLDRNTLGGIVEIEVDIVKTDKTVIFWYTWNDGTISIQVNGDIRESNINESASFSLNVQSPYNIKSEIKSAKSSKHKLSPIKVKEVMGGIYEDDIDVNMYLSNGDAIFFAQNRKNSTTRIWNNRTSSYDTFNDGAMDDYLYNGVVTEAMFTFYIAWLTRTL